MALVFPSNPTLGDLYVADNTVTYIWTGTAWDSAIPIHNGLAEFVYEGGESTSTYTILDNTLDGGTA